MNQNIVENVDFSNHSWMFSIISRRESECHSPIRVTATLSIHEHSHITLNVQSSIENHFE